MCDVVIVKTGRHKYLQSLLGDDTLDEHDPSILRQLLQGEIGNLGGPIESVQIRMMELCGCTRAMVRSRISWASIRISTRPVVCSLP